MLAANFLDKTPQNVQKHKTNTGTGPMRNYFKWQSAGSSVLIMGVFNVFQLRIGTASRQHNDTTAAGIDDDGPAMMMMSGGCVSV